MILLYNFTTDDHPLGLQIDGISSRCLLHQLGCCPCSPSGGSSCSLGGRGFLLQAKSYRKLFDIRVFPNLDKMLDVFPL